MRRLDTARGARLRPPLMSADQIRTPARSEWGAGIEPLLERLDDEGEAMVARTEAWSRINSGSREAAGLERMRGVLANAFAALPGEVGLEKLSNSQEVRADGEIVDV